MAYYGIDLGTSNCLIAEVVKNLDETFDVKCLSDDEGYESFPSVVYFKNEKEYKVGVGALEHLYSEPDSSVELVKVRLGKTNEIQITTDNNTFTKSPQEISSYILKHLNHLHSDQISNAVITVPAFFDQSQKDATMQAGKIAGLIPDFLIEEPTAAIMYHIFSEYKLKGSNFFGAKQEKNVLVFDFGGGTLDLSLIKLSNSEVEISPKVLAIGGDDELGGNTIDFIFTRIIIEKLVSDYPEDDFIQNVQVAFEEYYNHFILEHRLRFGEDVTDDIKNFIFRLKRNLEQVKIKLSCDLETIIVLEGQYRPISITRNSFEEMVLQSYELNIKDRVIAALNKISKNRIPISEVLLIGGSSQIPFVKDMIVEAFEEMGITKDLISFSNDFEQAVAKGAAIQSAISQGVAIPPFMLNKCESIVARDIEIEHTGVSQLFIPMGTSYPFDRKKEFVLKIGHSLSETVSLKLNELVVKNDDIEKRQICNFEFFLPIYYTNDDITLFMNIDEAGLYQIEAIHNNTDESVEFEPNKRFSLSENEIKKASKLVNTMVDIS